MSETNYYDAWTDEQIAAMKANEAMFGKLKILGRRWMKDAFQQLRLHNYGWLQLLHTERGWIALNGEVEGFAGVYRLDPDWTRPEPEKWFYRPALPVQGEWYVDDRLQHGRIALLGCVLDNCVGCGGVEFKEKPGVWCFQRLFVDNDGDLVYSASDGRDCNPATPNRVRFLRNA